MQEACRGEDREQVGVNGRAGMSCALMKMLARRSPPTLRAERRAAVLLFARNRGWRCEGAGQCKVCVGLRSATHAQARSQCVSDFLRDAFVMAGLIGLHFSSVAGATNQEWRQDEPRICLRRATWLTPRAPYMTLPTTPPSQYMLPFISRGGNALGISLEASLVNLTRR